MGKKRFRYLLRGIKYRFLGNSYSESGEDLIASYLLGTKKGVFVDIGAGHPIVGSNTYKFYRNGWKGVGIDANKDLSLSWRLLRPRDSFVAVAIGETSGETIFFEYENDLRSTSNNDVQEYYQKQNRKFKKTIVKQETLSSIFETYTDTSKPVFLSIDVEGSEYEVLKSLDFTKYSPDLIAIESWELPWVGNTKVVTFMKEINYDLVAYSGLTAFYMPRAIVQEIVSSRPLI